MNLKAYFQKHSIKYGPWATGIGLSPPIITNFLKRGSISLESALKVVAACDGEVSLRDMGFNEAADHIDKIADFEIQHG